jgi:predicted HD phosphohydrolase
MAQAIAQMYADRGAADYIGEPITQIEHALQAGYHALIYVTRNAVDSVRPVDLILASVLHDIGHLVTVTELDVPMTEMMAENQSWGRTGHEVLGAQYLRQLGVREPIPTLVQSHVDAKRYRVWKDPTYAARLTEASRMTLKFQGGPMTESEGRAFEQDPLFRWKLKLRECDEASKEQHQIYGHVDVNACLSEKKVPSIIPDLESFLALL